VYTNMHNWAEIRRRVLVEGLSKRAACRDYSIHWATLHKILASSEPHDYPQAPPRAKPKLGPFLALIHRILEEDRTAPPKQRHTAVRLFHRLRDEFGYRGGPSVVDAAVRAWKQTQAQVFIPLEHRPGEAQADFGRAEVIVAGRSIQAALFVMTLPFSDALFCCAFPRAGTEAFHEGHIRGFDSLGGVPRRITYDNTRIAVAKLAGGRGEVLTQHFSSFVSHYLFNPHFGLVRRPHEKGHVENLVGFARRNFLVPVPRVADWEGLNASLLDRCRRDLERTLRGQDGSKAELLRREQAALLPRPAAPFEAVRTVPTRANSLSLVRFDTNDYSVPTAYAHRRVTVLAGIATVRIVCEGQVVAVHRRCWERHSHQPRFEPVHYLGLLERKPGAFDQARPLSGWVLPEGFTRLRARLEEADPAGGTIQFIRVLRLLESVDLDTLSAAVDQALELEASSPDAVRVLAEHHRQQPVEPLSLEGRPHLQRWAIPRPDLSAYRGLLGPPEGRR
jgi:transposase